MSLVYFMRRADGVGPIKIGCSVLPERRLQALSIWSPHTLEITASAPGTFQDERRLHRQFSKHRLHGEWFEACPELLAVIARTVSTGQLPPPPVDDRSVRIAARLASGETYGAIGESYGVSRQRIEQIARKHSLPKRPRGSRRSAIWKRLPEVESLLGNGMTADQIATQFGVTRQTVYKVLKKLGVKATRAAHPMLDETVSTAFEVATLYKAGSKTAEIAEKIGCAQPAIYRYLRIAGVKPTRMKLNPVPQDTILKLYRDGLRLGEIAKTTGAATATIRRLAVLHGILRSKEENEAARIAAVRLANARRAA